MYRDFFLLATCLSLQNSFLLVYKIFKYIFFISLISAIALFFFQKKSRYFHIIANQKTIYENPNLHIKEYNNHFTENELDFAKKILPIADSLSVPEKVLRIENFIFDTISNSKNKVDFNINNSIAITDLQNAINKTMKVDCGVYTQIMNLFFNANNIYFRRVDVANIPDTSIGNHTFSEIFIPQKNEWAYTDMNSNKLFLMDTIGNYLNTLDVQNAIVKNNFNFIATTYSNNAITKINWNLNKGDETKCFLPMVDYTYYYTDHLNNFEKIKYFFTPVPWYATVTQSFNNTNAWFWCRIFCIFLSIISGWYLLKNK